MVFAENSLFFYENVFNLISKVLKMEKYLF